MTRIKYLREAPRGQAGEFDEVPEGHARILIERGFAELADQPEQDQQQKTTRKTSAKG
jgi:ribosomal protein L9